MQNRKDRWQYSMVAVLILALMMVGVLEPGAAQAANFGGLTDNGTARFMGIGTNYNTSRNLHVVGSPLFERAVDTAGFLIKRTATNRWFLGVNENPLIGYGFVISTFPEGAGSSTPRLLVMQDGRAGINTITPDSTSQLTVYRDGGSSIFGTNPSGTGVYGRNGNNSNVGYLGHPTYGVYGQYGSSGNYGSLGNSLYGAYGYGTGSNTGVYGQSSTGNAVSGTSTGGYGVNGTSTSSAGVYGQNSGNSNYGSLGTISSGADGTSTSGYGVNGVSTSNYGVKGTSTSSYGVYGLNSASNNYGELGTSSSGVDGTSAAGNGVNGTSTSGYGVNGVSASNYGVKGTSTSSNGVYGISSTSGNYGSLGAGTTGVSGTGTGSNTGVNGASTSGNGVNGISTSGNGVYGTNSTSGNYGTLGAGSNGVNGYSASGTGVNGVSGSGNAVYGTATSGNGVFGTSTSGAAGYFVGPVTVTGWLTKPGGSFKIDHPQDPKDKYLIHSFVESPEMMNIYRGNIVLDEQGEATVAMPSYFEALNRDFEYQLTCIGGYAPIYVAEKVKDNSFKIAGGLPGLEVSWQVTGARQDAYANAHPIVVEQEKLANEKGYYLHPVEWGQPKEKGIDQAPTP